ncbi:transcription factor [Coprinopsis marcescibilis]|uniref:Transcription factor n=1 Tax=Coprinopsis marcescibilis TaxID=230819 RepID=A0A5C3LB78_COPMA|nr:transcription factor [Coprinopsis marcescibilis]
MQSGPRAPGSSQPPVKIYNAVYSSVQVYECMVRGIAVMRRRLDSYVNATQILKVAGVDKGRRTKILEKEVLPGKHEIVQGGYGKYQGTWIPLERGRDIALQYGVAPLLSPLFDFQPNMNALGALPVSAQGGTASPRPLSASSSYSSLGPNASQYIPSSLPSSLPPAPIMPGSALRLLNQGRAQGLFTPSTTSATLRPAGYHSPGPYPHPSYAPSPQPQSSQTPPPGSSLKRHRSDADVEAYPQYVVQQPPPPHDAHMHDGTQHGMHPHLNGEENPSPAKRLRTDSSLTTEHTSSQGHWQSQPRVVHSQPPGHNGYGQSATRPSSSMSTANGNRAPPGSGEVVETHRSRYSSKPSMPRGMDPNMSFKDGRRTSLISLICQRDDPASVIDLLREVSAEPVHPSPFDIDTVLDDQGHTALHLAASVARMQTVEALISAGADVHRGNHLGETPLIRACLATHNSDHQTFANLVTYLHASIRTLDTSKKSVLHHIVSLAGVKGRAVVARYYLDQIFYWIAQHEGGDFRSLVDLQDEHGDTALNISARVGNRSLVRTLLDVGANRVLANKLGLRPGDFGVETEELSSGLRAEDLISSLRSGPPAPVQKSQDVIADMTAMVQQLSTDFQSEIKSKQDSLDVTQAHLRAATRELSEQRKQIQTWQARCGDLDQLNQRIRNVEKAIAEEDNFDWTGRTDLDRRDGKRTGGPAFQWRGVKSTLVGMGGSMDISFSVDSEPPLPTTDSVASLVKLRRLKLWQQRVEDLVMARLKGLQGASAEKEYQCKKIVALCTGISIDKVEEMLDNLVIAVESEAQVVDIGRVSGFMQKVRDGII